MLPANALRAPHIPETLETERLLLRCPRAGDGAQISDALRESWDCLQTWMRWASGAPPTVQQVEERGQAHRADYLGGGDLHFNVYLKATGEFVAKPSLFHLDWDVPKGEIGYWVRTRFVGQGLVTEAVLALTAFALDTLGFVRVEIRCDPRNTRSSAVAERAGYRLEGRLRHDGRDPQGGLRDTLVYARVREGAA